MTMIKLTDGDVFVTELGEGRPLLVLHGGLGLDHTYLRTAFDRFADTHRVIYTDFLGNGRSGRDLDYAAIHDNSIWVRQVRELLVALDAPDAIIAGHSYGGYVALEHAIATGADNPMLLVSTAPALQHGDVVVTNAHARGTPEQVRAVTEGLAVPQESDAAWEELWRTLLPLYFHAPTEAMLAAAVAEVSFSARGFNAAHLQVVPGYNVSDRLGRIAAPALVLSGDDDWILPVDICAQPLFNGIVNSALSVLPNCGHFPFDEHPALFRAIVSDWLKTV
jgi:proline iminopeptidase